MKNQYFADTRDLFKYDLVLEFLLNSNLNHFTFIPMLTKNEPNTYGRKIDYSKAKAGTQREVLRSFLEQCLKKNRRNIKELESFFYRTKLRKKIKFTIYNKNSYFSDNRRNEYFLSIGNHLLKKSVILADPDIGLEVRSMKGQGDKYIKYDEVKHLYNRMDIHSIFIIFQFIPRVNRERYFSEISKKLKKKVTRNSPVYFISDNQIVFFILTKGKYVLNSIDDILNKYGSSYRLKTGKVK